MIPGPRIVPRGYALGITGGHCDETGWAPGILERGPDRASSTAPTQALRAVRYQLKHGAKVIKICATAGVLSFDATVGAQQLSDEEMKTVVDEASAPRPEGRRARPRLGRHSRRRQGRRGLDRARLDADRRDASRR